MAYCMLSFPLILTALFLPSRDSLRQFRPKSYIQFCSHAVLRGAQCTFTFPLVLRHNASSLSYRLFLESLFFNRSYLLFKLTNLSKRTAIWKAKFGKLMF